MKMLVADEEERCHLGKTQQRSSIVAFLGMDRMPWGSGAAILGAWIMIAGSPHLQNDHIRVQRLCPIPHSCH